ncbi:MAG: hypothetical protein AB4290_19100, partial [Spirulina sp.]
MKYILIVLVYCFSLFSPQFVLGQTSTPETTEVNETEENEPLNMEDSAESGSMVGDFFTRSLETCELDPSYLNP